MDGFVFGPVVTASYFAEQGRTHPLFTRRAANALGLGLQNCSGDGPREGTEDDFATDLAALSSETTEDNPPGEVELAPMKSAF